MELLGIMEGKRKIKFCCENTVERRNYVIENAALYALITELLHTHKVPRLILHPDTLSKKMIRKFQIELLSQSLSEISDQIFGVGSICIEPRGGDRQGKVLRAELGDLALLQEQLKSLGAKKIGLCIDITQLFVVHGNEGSADFLEQLKSIPLSVKEFHISDVWQTKKLTNRIAMEIGTGWIDWKLILPLVLQHCNNLLIETLGGIKVFQRSKSYLSHW
jgi:hypothetical protein